MVQELGKFKVIQIFVDGKQRAVLPEHCTWTTFTDILSDCLDGTQKKVVIEYE